MAFQYQSYPFVAPPELGGETDFVHDVVVIGAGPVGLTMALALAKQGIKALLLDDNNQVSVGSRAICFSKRSLEVFDKLGVAQVMLAKGVCWNVGRIFFRDKEIDRFDLLPSKSSKYPAFINLQQYYIEQYLIEAALQEPNLEMRWLNKLSAIQQNSDCIGLNIETPAGNYQLRSKYLIAADGSRSSIRNLLGLELKGEHFEERFLIADFVMEADFPAERWFWFDPPFAPGQSILLHKQPDNLWRLDFKLGKNVDNSIAQDHDFIRQKIKSVVGDRPFELDWTSIYSFSSKMLDRFVHDQILFVGDSAHVVSPFGARGANSGIEDADNLSWKLAKILKGEANQKILETFNAERTAAAQQNITCTGASNLFIAPPSKAALVYRNSILEKAQTNPLAKKQINCGRLSVPCVYGKYPGSEEGHWNKQELAAGRALIDCPWENGDSFLIEQMGYHFTILTLKQPLGRAEHKRLEQSGIHILNIDPVTNSALIELYDLSPGSAYLITPDQYILGRWKRFSLDAVLDLHDVYLSGELAAINTWEQTEQEKIDAAVTQQIISS